MAINLTSFDDSVIYIINPAVSISYFVFLCLPAIILFLLCVVALLLTKTININLRVILLNVFAAEISLLLGVTVLFLGHPARVQDEETVNYSCNFLLSAIFCGGIAKHPANSLYAIVVYIYIKYGLKKVKWYIIVLSIALTWVISLSVSLIPYTSSFNIVSNHGFCYREGQVTIPATILSVVLALVLSDICERDDCVWGSHFLLRKKEHFRK